jgi:glyoxylase-like metal-dependent hydrolase (beta-lactamase superfamily II)
MVVHSTQNPIDMGNNVYLIDLLEQGLPCRTGAYVILDEQPTLIETGSAASHETLLAGLARLGVKPEDLAHIVVTHVHLDHAGGAGHMMEKATNAVLSVHPRGARHMANPERLWAGATQVYGDRVSQLFGSIKPVDEGRIAIRNHGDTLRIGSRTLTFFDSPGHAKHHFTVLDDVSNALYAGDAVGIRYVTGFTGWPFEWVMPSTSPVDFDPVAVERTIQFLDTVPFDWVYHAHFGKSPKEEATRETLRCAKAMAEWIESVYRPDMSVSDGHALLKDWVKADLVARGFQPPEDVSVLDIDLVLDTMGLMHYEANRRKSDA